MAVSGDARRDDDLGEMGRTKNRTEVFRMWE